MKISVGTVTKVVLCNREVEGSNDLVEAINRSTMAQLECRRLGKRPENCVGTSQAILSVASKKTGKKMSKANKRCPV